MGGGSGFIMEFNEKLQELRKRKGLTQEELAEALYVSRAAVSKWESGRGYPNIDSLKGMAKFFSVTVDELLSSDELLIIAEEDTQQKQKSFRDLLFGLLDLSTALFLFLPFFGQKTEGGLEEVSLLGLNEIAPYVRIAFFICVIGMILFGVLNLAMQNCHQRLLGQCKIRGSLLVNGVGILVFIVSSQPYAAAFLFVFLMIKVLILTKKR